MTEANKILAVEQDFISFCTDVGPAGGSDISTHPRAYGSFPRILSRYVRELGTMSLERAVSQGARGQQMRYSHMTAERLPSGRWQTLLCLIQTRSPIGHTFADPHEVSVGVKKVFVNGCSSSMMANLPKRVLDE